MRARRRGSFRHEPTGRKGECRVRAGIGGSAVARGLRVDLEGPGVDPAADVRDIGDMILCTNIAMDIRSIPFHNRNVERLGKMLAAADVMAQMADRTYLEKLVYLYRELKESNLFVLDLENELIAEGSDFGPDLFTDYFHLSERANRMIANRIFRFVVRNRACCNLDKEVETD